MNLNLFAFFFFVLHLWSPFVTAGPIPSDGLPRHDLQEHLEIVMT